MQGSTRHNGAKAVRDITLQCVVLHNMLRTHQGRLDRALNPADDIANEPVVYVPDKNYRNPLWEPRHQQDLLKDYFNHVGTLAKQEDSI